jgi:beta-glucosidase
VVVAIAAAGHFGADKTAASGSAAAPRRSVAARAPVAPLPVVLLSQGRPVMASSVQQGSTWVAANAVDGNTGTRWSSNFSDPQWLEVDLGAVHPITKVVLDWETAYAVAFQIQVSDDGSTWTDIYSTTTGGGGSQTLPVSGAGRYVRMYGTQRATQWGYSLWEFQVFGR